MNPASTAPCAQCAAESSCPADRPCGRQFRKRNAILACLCGTTVHPSAEWIYARLKGDYPDLSLATVYRNLARFKEQGVIVSLGNINGTERFDGNTAPHSHFICRRCGAVEDLPQITVPQALCDQAGALAGGTVEVGRLTFSGICSLCQNGGEKS